MRHLKNPTIFLRVVVLFLLVIIPVYMLVFAIIHMSGVILHKEIASSMESRISSYSDLIDSEINHIANLKTEYLYDEDLQKLSTVSITLNDYERLAAVNRFSQKLQLFKESSRIVEDVQVYIPNVQKTIRVMSYSAPMGDDEMRMIRETNTDRSPKIVAWNNQLILALYDPPFSGSGSNFYFKIRLSASLLQDSLKKITAKEDGKFFLTNATNSWMISNMPLETEQRAKRNIVSFLSDQTKRGDSGFGNIELDGENYFGAYRSSSYTKTTLFVAVPDRLAFGTLQRYSMLFWVLSIASVIILVAFAYWIFLLIHRPLQVMVRALRKVEHGDLNISLRHGKHDEFQYLYRQFNNMVSRLRELIHEVYEERIHSQQAELKQLQSQINPHFLYNSIFVLHRMAASYGLPDVTRFTDFLGKYFLFLTRTGSSEVGLSDEWNHAAIYTEIQKVRFAERIRVEWPAFPQPYSTIRVPRLIIQPILENAYKYGLEKKQQGGLLRIAVDTGYDGRLLIVIEDNGDELTDATLQRLDMSLLGGAGVTETTGLVNVHRRLQLHFTPEYGLSFGKSELGGLKVIVAIPAKGEMTHVPAVDRG
ncbi:MAG: histidine kinase [Paenibacillaceae bacterium]|nr:histidine kinase [Paenibacillaceae bacterium]